MKIPMLFPAAAVISQYLASFSMAELSPNGRNLFVYFSQSSENNVTLTELCNSAAVDVVILGFVRSFTGTGGYPTISFGPSNCNATRSVYEHLAPGLATCQELGGHVKRCQGMGKKVFVSIGGSTSNTTFGEGSKGGEEAKRAAKIMWDLFGDGKDAQSLRPFGPDVVVDGFDIDHEQGSTDNYEIFVSSLRSYRSLVSKPFYLSAAPVCTLGKATISRATLALVDFIFIRFYNSAECSLGTPGFPQSLKEWYQNTIPSPYLPFPKVLLGGLSFDNGNTGYVPAEEFRDAIRAARRPELDCWWNEHKFGGLMLWDGPRGLKNEVTGGVDFLSYVKDVLAQ